jgi:3-hydroxypropanoate dehydrogenase
MSEHEGSGHGDLELAAGPLFLAARTPAGFSDRPVPLAVLHRLWELVRLAPTAFNGSPLRVLFVTTPEAKERLLPALSKGNVEKTRKAPVTAVLGTDSGFLEYAPRLFPQVDVPALFAANPAAAEATGLRNATLQAGYFILAARLLGLSPGPMSGFDAGQVDAAFFPDGRVKSNILVNLGYADGRTLPPRNPRLDFDEACRVV